MQVELEQLRAENETLRQDRDKAIEFMGQLHHELRAPLASLQGYTQLLKTDGAENLADHQLNYLDTIQAGLNFFRLTFESFRAVALHGTHKPDDFEPLPLTDFQQLILQPVHRNLGDQSNLSIVVIDEISGDAKHSAISIPDQALVYVLSQIAREVRDFYFSEAIQVEVKDELQQFKLALSFSNSLREISQTQFIGRNNYEHGYADWSAKIIIELYGGEINAQSQNDSIQISIRLPLVELSE